MCACVRYLALDAAQVDQAEVAGQGGPEGGEGLQQRDASSLGQHGQRQHLVVQEGARHVTDHRREAVGGGDVGRLRQEERREVSVSVRTGSSERTADSQPFASDKNKNLDQRGGKVSFSV